MRGRGRTQGRRDPDGRTRAGTAGRPGRALVRRSAAGHGSTDRATGDGLVTRRGALPDSGSPGEEYDVAVVGAGVVGCAVARELAGHSLRVALVEASGDVGDGTSKANTAILHTGFDAVPGSLESGLVREGRRRLAAYAAAGVPARLLLLASTGEGGADGGLEGLAEVAAAYGCRD